MTVTIILISGAVIVLAIKSIIHHNGAYFIKTENTIQQYADDDIVEISVK